MKHEWIVRASQVGELMTQGRSKADMWGETAMKCIQKAVLFNKYGIEHNFTSKYTEKGIELEQDAIYLAKRVLGWDIDPEAPKQRLVNDWAIGEPDVNQSILADIKNSWSADTFPFFDVDLKNKSYLYQLQTYMWLSDKSESELVYCLLSCTEAQIQNEVTRLTYKLMERSSNISKSMAEIEDEAQRIVDSQLRFDHIPEISRVKRFIVKRDEDIIQDIKERIEAARPIYDQIYNAI
jgi:hypothetical protein